MTDQSQDELRACMDIALETGVSAFNAVAIFDAGREFERSTRPAVTGVEVVDVSDLALFIHKSRFPSYDPINPAHDSKFHAYHFSESLKIAKALHASSYINTHPETAALKALVDDKERLLRNQEAYAKALMERVAELQKLVEGKVLIIEEQNGEDKSKEISRLENVIVGFRDIGNGLVECKCCKSKLSRQRLGV